MADDPYRVLQVDPSAGSATIRVAYRALALVCHPDHAGVDGEPRMRELNAAWDVLGDPQRRAAYDTEHGRTQPAPVPAGPPGPRWTGRAGPPPGNPSGSVLAFGIFAGWSLGEIVRTDPGYLQWLEDERDTPEADSDARQGRPYLSEIDSLLRRRGLRGDPARSERAQPRGRLRFRR